jgi:hypothetical protein
MARKYADLRAEIEADPERRARIQRETERLQRRYSRPWWRVVRWWDRRKVREEQPK